MKNSNISPLLKSLLSTFALCSLIVGTAHSHGTGHHKTPKKKMQHNAQEAMDHSGHNMDHSGHDMKKAVDSKMNRADALTKSQDVVAVMNAWVREAVPESPVIGGYLTLINGSGAAVTLDKIESSQFDSIEIHKMGEVDGMMQMQQIEELTIDADGSVVLKPGDKHLMMMGPEKDLVEGDNVEVVMHFTNGAVQVINLPVKK